MHINVIKWICPHVKEQNQSVLSDNSNIFPFDYYWHCQIANEHTCHLFILAAEFGCEFLVRNHEWTCHFLFRSRACLRNVEYYTLDVPRSSLRGIVWTTLWISSWTLADAEINNNRLDRNAFGIIDIKMPFRINISREAYSKKNRATEIKEFLPVCHSALQILTLSLCSPFGSLFENKT